jgi:hypothetical protein
LQARVLFFIAQVVGMILGIVSLVPQVGWYVVIENIIAISRMQHGIKVMDIRTVDVFAIIIQYYYYWRGLLL